jgi:hypothetical protein
MGPNAGGPGGIGQGSRKTIVNSSMGMIGGSGNVGGISSGATGKLNAGKSKKITN